jgi:hypothetical protein
MLNEAALTHKRQTRHEKEENGEGGEWQVCQLYRGTREVEYSERTVDALWFDSGLTLRMASVCWQAVRPCTARWGSTKGGDSARPAGVVHKCGERG